MKIITQKILKVVAKENNFSLYKNYNYILIII